MHRVLIPVDRSEARALAQAKYVHQLATVAGTVQAEVLHVTPREASVSFEDVDAAVEAAEFLENKDIVVERSLEAAPVSAAIVDVVAESEPDEIVVGGRKRSGVTQILLGSTAEDVMLSVDVPVTLTGESVDFDGEIGHFLVPVDDDRERATHQADYLTSLVESPTDVEATVVRVFPHEYTEGPPYEFDESEAAVQAADTLETGGFSVHRVAVGGDITESIVETADDVDADTIVMGGRNRSDVQRVLLGSTTRSVFLTVERPVTITG